VSELIPSETPRMSRLVGVFVYYFIKTHLPYLLLSVYYICLRDSKHINCKNTEAYGSYQYPKKKKKKKKKKQKK